METATKCSLRGKLITFEILISAPLLTLHVKHYTLRYQVCPAEPALNYTGVGRQVLTLCGR